MNIDALEHRVRAALDALDGHDIIDARSNLVSALQGFADRKRSRPIPLNPNPLDYSPPPRPAQHFEM